MTHIQWNGEKIENPGVYVGLPIEEYHGHICVGPSISSSGLRTIEYESPAHYWLTSPFNPDCGEQPDNAAFSLGKAAHTLLLGESNFQNKYAVRPLEWDSWRTDAAKRWRLKQHKATKTVILPSDLDVITGMAENLNDSRHATDLLRGGIERSMVWRDHQTGMWLKSRPDSIPQDSNMFADLKTCASSHPEDVLRSIIKFGYHMQMALAGMGMREVMERDPTDYILIFVEKKPPYAVTITELSDELIEWGSRLCRHNINKFADSVRTNEWPGYARILTQHEFLIGTGHASLSGLKMDN